MEMELQPPDTSRRKRKGCESIPPLSCPTLWNNPEQLSTGDVTLLPWQDQALDIPKGARLEESWVLHTHMELDNKSCRDEENAPSLTT